MPRRFPADEGFDKVNFIIDSWSTGCDAPWYIYIETMGPAALEAFIVMLSFGWADVVRGAFRPKGLGRRSSKRKGKYARRLPRFPEIGNTLGKHIPMAEQLEDYVKWGSGTKFLWRIDNLIQAGLFMWLIVDVAEDFAFNWTSLLYDSYWCLPDGPGRFSYRVEGYGNIRGGFWKQAAFPTRDYETAPPNWFYHHGRTGANPAKVTAALSIKKHPSFGVPSGIQVRIIETDSRKVVADSGEEPLDADGNGSTPVSGEVRPHTDFEVICRMTGTPWALFGAGVVMAEDVPP